MLENSYGEKETFNKTHPELRDGEMFFHNIDRRVLGSWTSNLLAYIAFIKMQQKYKTLRTGQRAYNITGQPLTELVPLFVQKSEIEQLGETALFE